MVREFFKRAFRFEEPSPQPNEVRIVHAQPIGSHGTESYSGYQSEEYLQTMRGTDRADVFDKMRRCDSQIKMCLTAVKSPIKAATWDVEPYDQDDPDAVADADLIRWILFEGMEKTWDEFLVEALTMIDFGHSVFETIDTINFQHPEFGTINSLKSLAWRSPRTIERWMLDKETGKLIAIEQMAYGDLDRNVIIPAEFLTVFTLDKEGSNYEGISGLRPIYGNWFRKQEYLKLNAIGIEKFAIPTPVAEIPEGKENTAEYANLISVLESYLAHEKQYITHPVGWKIDLKTNTYDPQKVEVSIDNEDKRMVKGFLANFLELGLNGFGSQSLSFDLSDFFLGSIEHIASIITQNLNRTLIPRMVQLNRGPRPGYPKLKVSGISDKAGEELGRMLDIMTRSKIITPDDPLEVHMRKRLGLPEMSLEGQRKVEPQPQQGFGQQQSTVPQLAEKIRGLLNG